MGQLDLRLRGHVFNSWSERRHVMSLGKSLTQHCYFITKQSNLVPV